MIISEECRHCLVRQYINRYPEDAAPHEIMTYQNAVRDITAHSDGLCGPQIAARMNALQRDLFGPGNDFSEINRHFDELMLACYPYMKRKTEEAADPLKAALQYAMTGNYIDFGTLEKVDEGNLRGRLDKAESIQIEPEIIESFRNELLKARRLVYFTDNCGEIVADKLLISVMRDVNPEIEVTVILRGEPVMNDATAEDARLIRMEEVADRIIGNGSGLPGSILGEMSPEAEDAVAAADLLVAKGQGNYEGLCGCGLNVFYLFLCKCDLFTRTFSVPRFTGLMIREYDQNYSDQSGIAVK